MSGPVLDTSRMGLFEPVIIGVIVVFLGGFFGALTYFEIGAGPVVVVVVALVAVLSPVLLYGVGQLTILLINRAGHWLERSDHL